MLEFLVFPAFVSMLVAAFLYIRSMLKGWAKPNKITWLMWSIAPFIATAAAISNGVGWAVLPVFMSGFLPFLVFGASFFVKKSFWKLSSFDYFCGALSALALILWYVTKDPNMAIVFSIISDGLAAAPTLAKTWQNPETESAWPFIIGIFNAATSVTAATMFSFSELAFPVYLIAINILLVLSIFNKKLRSHRQFHFSIYKTSRHIK